MKDWPWQGEVDGIQGTLVEGEGSVQLTSFVRQLVCKKKRNAYFSILKVADLN
jgi:hypothetical protein